MALTIRELNEVLLEMATIYEYNEEETKIRIDKDMCCNAPEVLIKTMDRKTGIEIELRKTMNENTKERRITENVK